MYQTNSYYPQSMRSAPYQQPTYDRMYYGGDPRWMKDNRPYYPETSYSNLEMRDRREGTSPISRKMYMESKEMHRDKDHQMKDIFKNLQKI